MYGVSQYALPLASCETMPEGSELSVQRPSCPARRGQFSRKGNIQSFASVLPFGVGRWTFDPTEADKCLLAFGELNVHLLREFHKSG